MLSLNVTMLIGSRAKLQNISNSDGISPKLVIDDEVVPMTNEAKYLGIQIDKTLSWKDKFDYSPLIWMFFGKTASREIDRIHKRALRLVLNDFDSPFETLLCKAS